MSNDDAADDVEESAETEAEADEDEVTGLQEGDVIRLAYTARTVEEGHLVDTTDPEVAEEEGVGEDQEFEPRTIALGHGHIFDPVEADIIGKDVGDAGSVVVPAAEAFGDFEDDQVRTVSASKIDEEDRRPGAQVQIAGEQGIVETIIGGRARVDFNHPLAGDDIEYEYEIVEQVEDREEQAQGLLAMFLDVELEMWFQTDTVEEEQRVEPDEDEEAEAEGDEDGEDEEPPEPEFETVEVEKESLYIEAIPQLQMNQQWMMQKQQIAQQLMDLVDVDRVVIQEVIDGGGMGMPGMMGGMGGMGGGGGGLEEALEEADIDADDLDMDDVEDVAEEIEDAQ